MRNLLWSILLGVAIFSGFYLTPWFGLWQSLTPALLAMVILYVFVLAPKTNRKITAIFGKAAQALQNRNTDAALKTLESAYQYAPVQFGVKSQTDAQIGTVHFLTQRFDKAMPYLESALNLSPWQSVAMLAVVYYKKKRHDDMKKTLEIVTSRGKKQSLAWSLRAYLLSQIGERDQAINVLNNGLKKTQNDERVKAGLVALQNGKKIKMKAYKEQWYQFHLERPPMQMMAAAAGPRMKISKAQRRGR